MGAETPSVCTPLLPRARAQRREVERVVSEPTPALGALELLEDRERVRVLTALREPVSSRGRRLVVTGSIGVAFSTPASTSETLLRDADAALYQAKASGRNRVVTDAMMRGGKA